MKSSSVSVSRSLPRRGRLGRLAARPNNPPKRSPMFAPPVCPAESNRSFRLNSVPSPPVPKPPKFPPENRRRPKPPLGEQPPGFVVLLALGLVGQHAVGLRHRLEPVGGTRVVRVLVRVQLGSQLAVGPLDVSPAWRQRRRRAPCRSPSQPIRVGPSGVTSSLELSPADGSAFCGVFGVLAAFVRPCRPRRPARDAEPGHRAGSRGASRSDDRAWCRHPRAERPRAGTGRSRRPRRRRPSGPSPSSAPVSLSATDLSGPDSRSPWLRARSRSSSTPSSCDDDGGLRTLSSELLLVATERLR